MDDVAPDDATVLDPLSTTAQLLPLSTPVIFSDEAMLGEEEAAWSSMLMLSSLSMR